MNPEITACNDSETIGRDEAERIPETVSAMSNSSGGVITCEGFDPADLIPPEIPHTLEHSEAGATIRVPPLAWHKRPHVLGGRVWRRIEGVNVASGFRVKSIMAGDALELSRDDFPVNARLNERAVNDFMETVTALHGELSGYARDEFLRRCGVYSGEYLTFAGALMFGEVLRVRAVLKYSRGNAELEAANIWEAYRDILPRLTARLSDRCAGAFREIFTNALLHSDYNAGRLITFTITPNPPKVLASNPGTVRGVTRNHRLKRMFQLSGITGGKLHGLDIVREYSPDFMLEQDMLNLRTKAIIALEGRNELPEPVIL